MRLIVPEPKCELYETEFDESDLLGRKPLSQHLSQLVDTIEDPMVIALDGAWGSGKSFFLQRWVGAHGNQNGGKGTVVYFDAFEHDYLDDPLIALVGTISERFEAKKGGTARVWTEGKRIVAKLWRPALRMGVAVATGGISEAVGPVGDVIAGAARKELEDASEQFWRREDGKRAAMAEFRAFLTKQAQPKEDGESSSIIVVVDELDRCRPDYALQLLEIIKHFFAVRNVHFVLGVNLVELENSVKARYGVDTSARAYVQKFVTLRMQLPDYVEGREKKRDWHIYFEAKAKEMGLHQNIIALVQHYLKQVARREAVSLRGVQRLLSELVLVPDRQGMGGWPHGYLLVIAGLLVLKNAAPSMYSSARHDALTFSELAEFFSLNDGSALGRGRTVTSEVEYAIWAKLLDEKLFASLDENSRSRIPKAFGSDDDIPRLSEFIHKYLETIEISTT